MSNIYLTQLAKMLENTVFEKKQLMLYQIYIVHLQP